jgi:hypothetical protein
MSPPHYLCFPSLDFLRKQGWCCRGVLAGLPLRVPPTQVYTHGAVYKSGHVQGASRAYIHTHTHTHTYIWQYTNPGTCKGAPYIYIHIHVYTHIRSYGSIQIRARARTVRYALQGSSSQIAAGSTRSLCY